jgi:hypothetical protein
MLGEVVGRLRLGRARTSGAPGTDATPWADARGGSNRTGLNREEGASSTQDGGGARRW